MCTLIALFNACPNAPLVLALNRDELLSRPTEPVHRWTAPNIVAGRDVVAGGTWFAVGERVVAALTNHRAGAVPPARGERSRGDLVVRAASAQSTEEIASFIAEEPGRAYGGFHLLACDGRRLRCFTNRSGAITEEPAGDGVHVLGNLGIDDPSDPIVQAVRPAATALLRDDVDVLVDEDGLVGGLQAILRRHGDGWPCVHFGRYGTRMSAILLWREVAPRLLLTDGPSCESPWHERGDLLST